LLSRDVELGESFNSAGLVLDFDQQSDEIASLLAKVQVLRIFYPFVWLFASQRLAVWRLSVHILDPREKLHREGGKVAKERKDIYIPASR
jgi:hypothetical protein